ncbi:MAG: cyclopropane-fatty-acyl-phospholipid synthase family protein [Planctomycetes bacterium]|nr:cyclopropane-fatty-acyl-phospholipid synthase family protein [Planctomycetota bacterium]
MSQPRTISAPAPRDVAATHPGWLTRVAGNALSKVGRKGLLTRLEKLHFGELTIEEGGQKHRFGAPTNDGLAATLSVHDSRFWTELLASGTVGAGEAYRQGWWAAEDLTQVVRILVRNRAVMEDVEGGLAALAAPLRKMAHWANRNTIEGSRKNIEAHYDLSNDFFSLILDPTMTYSCGIYLSKDASLESASIEKIDRLCRKLELKPGMRLLEIGTGWGALAIHAAKNYGVRVTTTTISDRQAEWAERRITEEGLGDQVTLLRKDYRKLEGKFDRIVSVEMIEAIGWQYFDSYFEVIGKRLEDDGLAAIQAITIADQHYESARASVDFIQKYIFPGCCIPSISALLESATQSSDLKLIGLEDITPHYVRTLAEWRKNMFDNQEQVRALGLDDKFIRTWDYYFSYCEGGFAESQLGDVQMLFGKPRYQVPA